MKIHPSDHTSERSFQPSARMTSGPRYCLVLITDEWCSSSYVALPKSISRIWLLAGRTYPDEPRLFDDFRPSCHVDSRGKVACRGGSMHSSRMFSGLRSVCVICSLLCRKPNASRHWRAKLWMSCIQKPRKLLFFRKSYRDTPHGSKTKQKCLPCEKVSYMIALLEDSPRGSTLRMSFRMSASILAFSAYRLTSLMTLMATSRFSRWSCASRTRPKVPSPNSLTILYLWFMSIPFCQEKWTISSLSESPDFFFFLLSSDDARESELLLYSDVAGLLLSEAPRWPLPRSRPRPFTPWSWRCSCHLPEPLQSEPRRASLASPWRPPRGDQRRLRLRRS
mmetsp:Transcript_71227/g.219820  ORF Transcript_71227/g.219820 Transcript_71227/m.219820 type:complete len:336 (+) Transcript_71227:540-1547(+)